jgi:D-galacturonate reductase
VLVVIEVHKRYDPVYNDAKNRIQKLGDFSYFTSYMSQPKFQLETFKSWAGKSSDISFYLNSHHVDFHLWAVSKFARPTRVFATCSTGVAKEKIGVDAEDTITLTVEFENMTSGNKGTASYTASWSAPKSDVHSQQRFFYMGHKGEVTVDQAHRGYTLATDEDGYGSVNPLYMRYTPDDQGRFCGQHGYGYQSFEVFVDAVNQIRNGDVQDVSVFDSWLPTAASTLTATAVLEAGRRSLDSSGMPMLLEYDAHGVVIDIKAAF